MSYVSYTSQSFLPKKGRHDGPISYHNVMSQPFLRGTIG